MKRMQERGLFELYLDDPERGDALLLGRRTGLGRRGFLKGGLATAAALVGGSLPFADRIPGGWLPAALAQTPGGGGAPSMPVLKMDGKSGLIVLQDRPLNAETPIHQLNDPLTPVEWLFIRNNGLVPDPVADPKGWKITIDGEVNQPLTLSLGELQQKFPAVTYQMMLECGGNGRSFFVPETRGNQWGNGAAGHLEWTGVRLRDVLRAAEPKSSAVYTGHFGADIHLSGDKTKAVISRGVRLEKAMEEHTLIAWAINGKPIPQIHGAPVRLIVPGWPGSASQKWLTRITLRNKEHDGPGMGGASYRLTKSPMIPGGKTPDSNMAILESMPIRTIITNVANGAELPAGTRKVDLQGAAWAGEKTVRAVHVSIDYGATWQSTDLGQPANKYSWQRWKTSVNLPSEGYYELWSRGTDSDGKMQPHVAAFWNPQGYGGNPFHRVAVLVKG